MKKLLGILLAMLMVLSLAACNQGGGKHNAGTSRPCDAAFNSRGLGCTWDRTGHERPSG